MLLILIVLFSILFIFLAARNFHLALAFVVFALPAYLIRFDLAGIPTTMLEIMIWLVFLVHLARMSRGKTWADFKRGFGKPGRDFVSLRLAMLSFLLVATAAAVISPSELAAWGVWKAYFLEAILFFVVAVREVKTRKQLELLWYALGLSVLVVFAFGVLQKFTGWKLDPIYMVSGRVDRITSVYGFPNAIGLYVGPIVVFYAGWLLQTIASLRASGAFSRERSVAGSNLVSVIPAHAGIQKIAFQLLVTATGLTSIVLAKSDGALAGVAVAFALLGLATRGWRALTATVLVAVVALSIFFPPVHNFVTPKVTFTGWSEKVRLIMWHETWGMVHDRPVLGVGLSAYPTEFVRYHKAQFIEIFQYPHNTFLNFLVEMGALGLLAFLWVVGEYVRLCVRLVRAPESRAFGVALLAVMVEIFVHGLVDVPYFKNDLSVLFWLLLAFALCLNLQRPAIDTK